MPDRKNCHGDHIIDPAHIEWQWDDAISGDTLETEKGRYLFTAAEEGTSAQVALIQSGCEALWRHAISDALADSAALAIHDAILYFVLYSRSATGASVFALEADTGRLLWKTQLVGLGSTGHSKYSNRAQIRIVGDGLVVFGDEASGKYIEVLDPLDGRLVHNRKVRR